MTFAVDLASLPENDRIRLIGKRAMQAPTNSAPPAVIGFFVEDDAKADRYIAKLQRWFPSVRVIGRGPGPGGTILVRVGPPAP